MIMVAPQSRAMDRLEEYKDRLNELRMGIFAIEAARARTWSEKRIQVLTGHLAIAIFEFRRVKEAFEMRLKDEE